MSLLLSLSQIFFIILYGKITKRIIALFVLLLAVAALFLYWPLDQHSVLAVGNNKPRHVAQFGESGMAGAGIIPVVRAFSRNTIHAFIEPAVPAWLQLTLPSNSHGADADQHDINRLSDGSIETKRV